MTLIDVASLATAAAFDGALDGTKGIIGRKLRLCPVTKLSVFDDQK